MGRIVQIICGCVLAIALSGYAAVDRQTVEQRGPAAAQEGNRSPQQPPLSVTIVETDAQAKSSTERQAKADEHERLDLIAQEKAANAAYTAAWLSGLGTLLVFFALIQNGSANIRQNRAYLTLKEATLMPLVVGGKVDLHIVFRNGGATPAYKVKSNAAAKVCAPDDATPPLLGSMSQATHVVGGGDTYTAGASLSPSLSARDIALIEAGKQKIWVVARLEYLDAFKRRRFVCASLKSVALSVDGKRQWVFSPTEHGNDAN